KLAGVEGRVALGVQAAVAADAAELDVAEVHTADVHAARRQDVRRIGRRLHRAGRRHFTYPIAARREPGEAEIAAAIGDRALQHRTVGGAARGNRDCRLARVTGVHEAY